MSLVTKPFARCSSVPLTLEKTSSVVVRPRIPMVLNSSRHYLSPKSLVRLLPTSNRSSVISGVSVGQSVRFYHADVAKVPSFDDYRSEHTKDPTSNPLENEMDRKFYYYTMGLGCTSMVAVGAKYLVKTFLWTLQPGFNAKQAGMVEVKLDEIPEGKNLVLKWRNKPLFVRHRSAEEVARERAVPISTLRDPERDEDRVKNEKWLICIGVCTHLGCIPTANSGDYPGGYYCPCHGSHYDASGRIRRGPAPKNLEIPNYQFADENLLVVG